MGRYKAFTRRARLVGPLRGRTSCASRPARLTFSGTTPSTPGSGGITTLPNPVCRSLPHRAVWDEARRQRRTRDAPMGGETPHAADQQERRPRPLGPGVHRGPRRRRHPGRPRRSARPTPGPRSPADRPTAPKTWRPRLPLLGIDPEGEFHTPKAARSRSSTTARRSRACCRSHATIRSALLSSRAADVRLRFRAARAERPRRSTSSRRAGIAARRSRPASAACICSTSARCTSTRPT